MHRKIGLTTLFALLLALPVSGEQTATPVNRPPYTHVLLTPVKNGKVESRLHLPQFQD